MSLIWGGVTPANTTGSGVVHDANIIIDQRHELRT